MLTLFQIRQKAASELEDTVAELKKSSAQVSFWFFPASPEIRGPCLLAYFR